MATSIFSRRNIFRNSINSNVLFMKNLLNAIQNTCIAISQKENGKYFAFCEYSGHVDEINIRVSRRPTYETFFNESVYLDSKNPTAELQKILDQLTLFYNE